MAKVIIGGTDYTVPELNFIALERAWPFIEEAMTSIDPMKAPAAAISVIAAGICESEHFQPTQFGMSPDDLVEIRMDDHKIFERVVVFLKKKLKATEIMNVRQCVLDIIEEAGLDDGKGEAQAGTTGEETQNPSTETVPASSLSSSLPDAREVAGTV